MTKNASPAVPVFKLYGESQQWPTPDLLHCETISRRSREYQWEIQPHRHADLCQLLYVYKGQAQLEIEGQRTTLTESTLQVLPPLCVHGFRFAEDVQGFVVTLAAPLVAHLQGQLGSAVDGLSAWAVIRRARTVTTSIACLPGCRMNTTTTSRPGT